MATDLRIPAGLLLVVPGVMRVSRKFDTLIQQTGTRFYLAHRFCVVALVWNLILCRLHCWEVRGNHMELNGCYSWCIAVFFRHTKLLACLI